LKEVDSKTEGFRLAIATANERAAKAQESLALAEQHSSEANAKAEGFRRDIAQANERAAEANRIAEQERLARLQIEARLADRIISPVQEQKMEAAFAPLKGKTVDVAILGDTMEITQFSTKIITAMRKAGVLLIVSHPIGGPSARGVLAGVKSDAPAEFKKTADEFIAILQQTGNGAGLWDFDQLVSGGAAMVSQDQGATAGSPLRIFIGSK
jgi:prephenate dehydrogenase